MRLLASGIPYLRTSKTFMPGGFYFTTNLISPHLNLVTLTPIIVPCPIEVTFFGTCKLSICPNGLVN